jgi:hypothetical protein
MPSAYAWHPHIIVFGSRTMYAAGTAQWKAAVPIWLPDSPQADVSACVAQLITPDVC